MVFRTHRVGGYTDASLKILINGSVVDFSLPYQKFGNSSLQAFEIGLALLPKPFNKRRLDSLFD